MRPPTFPVAPRPTALQQRVHFVHREPVEVAGNRVLQAARGHGDLERVLVTDLGRVAAPIPGTPSGHSQHRRLRDRVDHFRIADDPHGMVAKRGAVYPRASHISWKGVFVYFMAKQPRSPSAVIWVNNHALASLQSRLTVSGETPTTSAVSSTLNPPK